MQKLKVLLVDDNKTILSFYKMGLKDEFFEKKFASNGKEAVQTYNDWLPDVIVLDIMMPVMSGYQALKEIRELEKENGRNTTIIVTSALADKSDIVDCAKIGIQGYILKPMKHEELAEKIQSSHAANLAGKNKGPAGGAA